MQAEAAQVYAANLQVQVNSTMAQAAVGCWLSTRGPFKTSVLQCTSECAGMPHLCAQSSLS